MLMRSRITAGLTLVTAILALTLFFPSLGLAQTPAKLLISQVEIRGSGTTAPNEYIVIKNPGSVAVDLSNYYLTDATFPSGDQYYYNLPDPAKLIGGGTFTDFVARFPAGAMIQPGQELSISMLGSTGFQAAYGKLPNFEMFEDGGSADDVPDMRPARSGSIKDPGASGTAPTLSNTSEVVILFYWDGASDLVTDVDYVLWGTATSAGVSKTGISIDGPDGDATPTAYLADTPVASQATLPGSATGTFIRTNDAEGTQVMTGGNGVGGRNETSENLAATFSTTTTGVPPGQTSTDTAPPTLVSATGSASSVTVVFSEALGSGAATASNYSVYPTAAPASTIAVTAAALSGSSVTLTLASPLAASTAYTVKVSNVQDVAGNTITANSTVAFNSGGGATSFTLVAAFQFGSDYVGVAFSEKVNAAQATTAANYSFSPTLAITSVTMQENGQTAIIKTSAALPKSTAYTLTVSGLTSLTGGSLSGGTANFSTVSETVTNIATIQGSASTYAGQSLTMIGQVYVTASSNGTTTSAFIQDGSGRGLNVFGGSIKSALDDRGNVAKVTGVVELYFTTTEITGYTATLLTSGVPRLAPKVLTVAQMKSSAWEGTYIQTTAALTAAPSASGSSNYNYTAGDVIFRVRNAAGINAASYASGDVVTAAGFGSAFGSGSTTTYQIGVGHADNFSKGGFDDTTAPTLSSASGAADSRTVVVMFSEALGTGANVAANYSVYPTATPASPIAVSSATFSVNQVTLTLASGLVGGTAYTVQVSNVQDLAGNSIAAGSVAQFTAGAAVVAEGLLDVPARTLLRGYVMPNGAEQAIEVKMNSEGSAKATCRVFDLQGRVVKVLYDGVGAKRTLKWNGRDETFEFVRAGLYICHLMTTSLDGTIRREQVPIVVSVRLD